MLCAENITKSYAKPVLADISFSVERGQVLGIAGANGSGKSTLLSILAAIRRPDRGRVTLEGVDVLKKRNEKREKIGYVPQEVSLFENLSVLDNIKYWAAAYHVDYRRVPFDTEYYRQKVKHLSGGVQKWLSIAVSLPHDPDYILMDEPTAALDLVFKKELADRLGLWKAQRKAVAFTSHQPDELMLCDRILVLKAGRIVFEGEPSALCGDLNGRLYGLLTETGGG